MIETTCKRCGTEFEAAHGLERDLMPTFPRLDRLSRQQEQETAIVTAAPFGDRARAFLSDVGKMSTPNPDYEKNEINEERSASGPLNSSNSFISFAALDEVIVASEAGRRPLDEIENRLMRLTARAAEPTASPRDHQLVRDWTAICNAKRQGREAA